MTQNKSHAVMNQRVEPHDSLDDFPTPPWATRALLEHVLIPEDATLGECWEPACNRGYMMKALAEQFYRVWGSDIMDYGVIPNQLVRDFLFPNSEPSDDIDWVITNPPFRLASQFIERGLQVAREGVAVLVRTSFLEGKERYETLFHDNPPWAVCQFVERVPMVKGRYDPKASTATSYAWLVWLKKTDGLTRMIWIPPCRKELERADDAPQT